MRLSDSFDRENAREVEYVGRPKPTNDEVAKARSMSIVRMRHAGYSFAAIARFHGISRQYVKRLYDEMPEHVKHRVGEILGGRGDAVLA